MTGKDEGTSEINAAIDNCKKRPQYVPWKARRPGKPCQHGIHIQPDTRGYCLPLPSFIIDPETGEKRQKEYSHPDLKILSLNAFNDGQDYFTCRHVDSDGPFGNYELCENEFLGYVCGAIIDKDVYEQWFCGSFTKTICEAKNRNQLLKAVDLAKELELQEGLDFFLIKDNCLTELEPEEIDENGIGRTLTCIGFRPLPDDIAHHISRKYQLYR